MPIQKHHPSVRYNPAAPAVRIIQYSFLRMELPWNNPNRNAPFWRFYWNAAPGAEIRFNGKCIRLVPENVVLIPPHINYASFSAGAFTQLYMHFQWDPGVSFKEPAVFPAAPFSELLHKASFNFGRDDEMYRVLLHALLLSCLAQLQLPETVCKNSKEDERITRAVELMNKDLTLSNAETARKVNMSCDNFQRVFRKKMGVSPCSYRMARRMEKAQILLQNTDKKLQDIAVLSGFVNSYQLSKAFRKFFGIPPGTVRKK